MELALGSVVGQTYGFALATLLAGLLLLLVKHSGGADKRARFLFGLCLLIANVAGLTKNVAFILNQHAVLGLTDQVRAVGFISASFVPLSLIEIWRTGGLTGRRRRVGIFLRRYALLTGLLIAIGLVLQASFPGTIHTVTPLRLLEDQDRIGNLTFYNGLIIASLGAVTLLPGKLRDVTLRIAVFLILLGLSVSSIGALLQSSSDLIRFHGAYGVLRFQGIGLVVLGAVLYFSRFRAADVFAKEALKLIFVSVIGLGIALGISSGLENEVPQSSGHRAGFILLVGLIVTLGILIYPFLSRRIDLIVERFVFHKRDVREIINGFNQKLTSQTSRNEIMDLAISVSHELLSARVSSIRFGSDRDSDVPDNNTVISVPNEPTGMCLVVEFPEHRGFLLSGEVDALSEIAHLVSDRLREIQREQEKIETLLQESRLRQAAVESELRALRAQINPHFFFNSLNTIAALIVDNPAAAEDITVRLARIFRHVLLQADRPMCRIGDEVAFLKSYLEIEKIRFGERLQVSFVIEPDAQDALIPSLILQPIVENAIKYAVSPRIGVSQLKIEARVRETHVVLSVEDDGLAASATLEGQAPIVHSRTGVGLKNIRERLDLMYGPEASFSQIDVSTGGKCFVLELPWRVQ